MCQLLGVNCALTNQQNENQLKYIEIFNTNKTPRDLCIQLYKLLNNILFENQRFIMFIDKIIKEYETSKKHKFYHCHDKARNTELIISKAFYEKVKADLSAIQTVANEERKTIIRKLTEKLTQNLTLTSDEIKKINENLANFSMKYVIKQFIDKNSMCFMSDFTYTIQQNDAIKTLPEYGKKDIYEIAINYPINEATAIPAISITQNESHKKYKVWISKFLQTVAKNIKQFFSQEGGTKRQRSNSSSSDNNSSDNKRTKYEEIEYEEIEYDTNVTTEVNHLYIYLYDSIYDKLLQLNLEEYFEVYKYLLLYEFQYLNEVYYDEKLDYIIYYLTIHLCGIEFKEDRQAIKILLDKEPFNASDAYKHDYIVEINEKMKELDDTKKEDVEMKEATPHKISPKPSINPVTPTKSRQRRESLIERPIYGYGKKLKKNKYTRKNKKAKKDKRRKRIKTRKAKKDKRKKTRKRQ